MTSKQNGFKDFVMDQLSDLRGVTARAMFGGYGLYRRDAFFGIIHKSRLYFKTSDETRATFIRHGMRPFRPNGKQTLKTYYEVPADIVDDAEQLAEWAQRSASLTKS